jgi:hypothetical protein
MVFMKLLRRYFEAITGFNPFEHEHQEKMYKNFTFSSWVSLAVKTSYFLHKPVLYLVLGIYI